MRIRWVLGGLTVAAVAGACGAAPPPVASDAAPRCDRSMPWGGWDGSPECAAIARAVIAAEDLGCRTDADCVLVGVTKCGANCVAKTAQARWKDHPPACGHPAAGMCAPVSFVPECRGGCCNVGVAR